MAYDFPNAPTVGQTYQGYTWDGEKWTLPTTTPAAASPVKNYVINGAMMISQENALATLTTSGTYPVDQWSGLFTTSGLPAFAQVASPTPGGSPNRIRFSVPTTGDATVDAGDAVQIRQAIEGLRVADLRLGSAAAKTVTLRFGVKAPAGTYCVSMFNANTNRSYVAEYTISAAEASVDTVKTITIALDTTGAWAVDNTVGLYLNFVLMAGSTYRTTPGAWVAGAFLGTANISNFMGTVGNVFELFDVGLYVGTVAPAYAVPDYAPELDLCKRYYERRNFVANQFLCTLQCVTGASANGVLFHFPEKRAAPTVQLFPGATSFNLQAAAGGGGALNNIINIGVNPVSYWAQPTIASGLVAGNAASMYATATSYVSFNARM